MPDYDWECSVCGKSNSSSETICPGCNSPPNLTGLEIEARRSGAPNVKAYLLSQYRKKAQDPYVMDMVKCFVMFFLVFGLLRLSIWLESTALMLISIPPFLYMFVFFGRVWWRMIRYFFTGKPYERV
jgi:hypothetical protein